jgi:hypothetical protein
MVAYLLVGGGLVATSVGVGVQFGWPWTAIVGGAVMVAIGLLAVEVDK